MIDTGDAAPICQPPHRLPLSKKEETQKQSTLRPPEVHIQRSVQYCQRTVCMVPMGVNDMHAMHVGAKKCMSMYGCIF